MSVFELTDVEKDAITELLNIGAGRAAAALSEMVDQEVTLAVPSMEFVPRSQMDKVLGASANRRMTVLKQHFTGPFWGDALLLFPEERSMDLVRQVMKDTVPLDSLGELEQEALTEIGNVILNACISSLSNSFGIETECALPDFLQAKLSQVFLPAQSEEEPVVLFLRMDFSLKEQDIHGYLAFILDITALDAFVEMVDKFVGDL